jgi:hypothetical protein
VAALAAHLPGLLGLAPATYSTRCCPLRFTGREDTARGPPAVFVSVPSY